MQKALHTGEFNQHFTALTEELWLKMFLDVKLFRETFEMPIDTKISELDDKRHQALHIEELVEIALAKDAIEQADGLVDLAVTLIGRTAQSGYVRAEHSHIARTVDMIIGACIALNLPFEPLWDEVMRSNLSKAASSKAIALETVAHYESRGIAAGIHRSHNGKFIITCTRDSKDETGSPIIQGKLLKSIDYSPADIASLLVLHQLDDK